MTGGLRINLLGPLEVLRDDRVVKLGGIKPRLVMALLALEPGRVVPVDSLVEALWPGEPPDKAIGTLQVHVSAVRRALGSTERGPVVVSRSGGYALDADPGIVDATEFADLVRQSRAHFDAHRYSEAATMFRRADALWRGAALGDLNGEHAITARAAALEEARVAALEARFAADLGRGAHTDVATELRTLVADHPLREDFWALLVVALYRSGRQADALAALREVRERLLDELGIDPGAALQALERDVLAQDPVLDWPGAGAADGDVLMTTIAGAAGSPHVRAALVASTGQRFDVTSRCTIGRHPESTIVLDDPRASRRHAEIRNTGGRHVLSDLGSTNGTSVNGERIDDCVLADGDEVEIGGTRFRYESD